MLTAPSLAYSLIAPMLIVLGGALVGVLVEAIKELKAEFEAYKKTHP